MHVRRILTRGIAAVAAAALPLWMSAQPAAAFESHSKEAIVDHTFTDAAGDSITCSIKYDSHLRRGTPDDPYSGEAATQILLFDSDPSEVEACRAQVGVEVTYHDLTGREQHARAFGIELADLQLDEVDGNFIASHSVFFVHCALNCSTTFTTSPK